MAVVIATNETQIINLTNVTKVSIVRGQSLRFWAGSNVELTTVDVPSFEVAQALLRRLGVLMVKPETSPVLDGVLSMQKLIQEAEEYVNDNK